MPAPNYSGPSDRERELERKVESLERQLEQALAEMERLRKKLEEALRANKRSITLRNSAHLQIRTEAYNLI